MKNMNRLEEEYSLSDTAEERRIIWAIINAGAVIGIILSLMLNVLLLIKLAKMA